MGSPAGHDMGGRVQMDGAILAAVLLSLLAGCSAAPPPG